MELSTMTESNTYDNCSRLSNTNICRTRHESVMDNLRIKVCGFKDEVSAPGDPENKNPEHSSEKTMIELTKCPSLAEYSNPSPGPYSNQEHSSENTMIELTKCPSLAEYSNPSPTEYSNQDSPLDFSVKRRTSLSGSLTDDSHTSSSPGDTTDYSIRSQSSDPIPVDDIGSNYRLRTPSSDGSGDPTSFELTQEASSSISLPGFLGNFGFIPSTLVDNLTHKSQKKTLSQLTGVMLNEKYKENSSLLKQYQNEAFQMPLGFLGVTGPAAAAVHNSIGVSSLISVNTKSILHMYQQQLELMKAAELAARLSTQPSYTGKHQPEQQKFRHYIRTPSTVTTDSVSPHSHRNSTPRTTVHTRNSPLSTGTDLTFETSILSQSSSRKRPSSLPDDQKDEAYWERRRKNNDAAKRSRDARRAKEEEIAIRASFMEQENLNLREQIALLRTETNRLRHMLYSD